jgi:hypothetical protein
VKAAPALSSASVDAVLDLLRTQDIAFRGPFHTPGKNIVFVVEGHIFLESELIDLYRKNRLHRETIQEFGRRGHL